ncbi:MAG: hypothetical protein K8U57_22605 [Planctomycetes bacterium]|nr:hypothetical protein [Planctomycetota bacterium]
MSPQSRTPETSAPDAKAAQSELLREDGSIELTQRTRFHLLFNDPAIRNYVIAAFSALAMIFLILAQQGGDLGGLLIVVIGTAGITLRWTAAPAFVLFVLTYFMVFPTGAPIGATPMSWEIEEGLFRPHDLMLAMAVMVYVATQFRILGFVHQAIAVEGAVRRHDEPVTRRPSAVISSSELGMLMFVLFVMVVVGQLVWWVLNSVEIMPGEEFPFKWIGTSRRYRRLEDAPGGMPAGLTRFVLMIGLFGFGVLLARLVFGYWRLRAMPPAEGAMILIDDGWLETKRERSRQEKWRIWGRERAKTMAEAEAKEAAKTKGKR